MPPDHHAADLHCHQKHMAPPDDIFWAALSHPRCDALCQENAVLSRELGKVQERITRVIAQKTAEIERLQGDLMQARAAAIAKDSRIAYMAQDLQALQASIPQLEDKQRLQKRVNQMAQRQSDLENHNAELFCKLAVAENALLEIASMAAADVVICQTGCISHNAYWKVKDFCKRTGKQCVFVESPSDSSLARGLAQISRKIADATPAARNDGALDTGNQATQTLSK